VPFHAETHRYCYPDTGIEMPLGVMPVTECNRWEPVAPDEGRRKRERAYRQSKDGGDFAYQVARWEGRRRKAMREAEEAERLILDAQVEAEFALCTFSSTISGRDDDYDAPSMRCAWCDQFPDRKFHNSSHNAAHAAAAAHARARIREMILNNEPLPSTRETNEHRTTEE
jgi:hypothetical protein